MGLIGAVNPMTEDAADATAGRDPALPIGREGLWAAFRAIPAVKTLGITLFTAAVIAGYFWVLHHPLQPVVVMPTTVLDRWVPFSPAFGPAYFSLWIYLSLCAGLIPTARQLVVYGVYAGAVGLLGLVVFLVWPTAVPSSGVDWALHPSLAFLKQVDASGNACPSLHVAYVVYSAAWVERLFSELRITPLMRGMNLLWAGAIVYSTVAIRQHVVIDVILGAALGLAGAFAFLRARRALIA